MPKTHVVANGECISTIAYDYGIGWKKIWDDPKNAALKKLRKDPNVLREGDSVVVPDKEQKAHSIATGAKHKFVVKTQKIRLRLRVVVDNGPKPAPEPPPKPPQMDRRISAGEDPEPASEQRSDEPRGTLAYVLDVEGQKIEGTTDGDGYLECEVPPRATRGRLTLAPGTPHETEVQVNLGHLDPATELKGVKQRLRNLCFDCGALDDQETPELEAALRDFQSKHGLKVTGVIDDTTRAEIVKAHDK